MAQGISERRRPRKYPDRDNFTSCYGLQHVAGAPNLVSATDSAIALLQRTKLGVMIQPTGSKKVFQTVA